MRLIEDNKYFKTKIKYSEEFVKVLDFVIKTILKKEINTICFGSSYQYMKYTGKIRAYLSKREKRNQKSLILKGDNFEIECLTEYWDEMRIRKKSIDIEEVGLYIEFKRPIDREYNAFKKHLGGKK